MATLDQLSADQRAIIELVLRQGQSYERLAELLSMPQPRVQELAQEALITLAPVSVRAVEENWRGEIADYILGQQSGPESVATRGHLRRSEGARTWAHSLLDSLETLFKVEMPTIPDSNGAGRSTLSRRLKLDQGRERTPSNRQASRPKLSPAAEAAIRRRQIVGGAGVALAVATAVLVWPIGLLTGDDEKAKTPTAPRAGRPGQKPAATGVAVIAQTKGRRQVVVQATVPPTRTREAYEVWLYNSPTDAKSLGAQLPDKRGTYQGAGTLPDDYAKYRFIDVSREPLDDDRRHSGLSVLRGRLKRLRAVPENQKNDQPALLGQVALAPPGQ